MKEEASQLEEVAIPCEEIDKEKEITARRSYFLTALVMMLILKNRKERLRTPKDIFYFIYIVASKFLILNMNN